MRRFLQCWRGLKTLKRVHQVYPHFQTISILMRPHQSCNKIVIRQKDKLSGFCSVGAA